MKLKSIVIDDYFHVMPRSIFSPVAADGEPPAVGEEERVLGVFEDANGVRKAWVVHRPCRCAPGFVMVVR